MRRVDERRWHLPDGPEFVGHMVDDLLKEKMNICSADVPYGTNEIERAGFPTEPSVRVRPPRLGELPVQFNAE
jgi:flavin reductase (DIM6/NTAB) family NADH-FMN oxidoreductase RutF